MPDGSSQSFIFQRPMISRAAASNAITVADSEPFTKMRPRPSVWENSSRSPRSMVPVCSSVAGSSAAASPWPPITQTRLPTGSHTSESDACRRLYILLTLPSSAENWTATLYPAIVLTSVSPPGSAITARPSDPGMNLWSMSPESTSSLKTPLPRVMKTLRWTGSKMT